MVSWDHGKLLYQTIDLPALPNNLAVNPFASSPSTVASDRNLTTFSVNGRKHLPGIYWINSSTLYTTKPLSR